LAGAGVVTSAGVAAAPALAVFASTGFFGLVGAGLEGVRDESGVRRLAIR
jgi:hypothetical protein